MIKNLKTTSNNKPTQERRRIRPKREKSKQDQMVIFGQFQKHQGKDFVMARNVLNPVYDIKKTVSLPIPLNFSAKAWLQKQGAEECASILRVLGPKLTLKERITRVLTDAAVRLDFPDNAANEAKALPE